ncbi:alpha-glucosidase [Clostridia bacterium]|nr:alpha-glucosidase [Clostridia bacterium]GHV32756.1 alpha-glucosidase [Clostridia bacterium]
MAESEKGTLNTRKTPQWWENAVIYQIYPQAFCNGDIAGIISKLDYLANLGVDAVWLCPLYPSPGRDNGYDISDYDGIAPKFGTMDDFKRLVKEAHVRNIRVIIDLVLNHTSNQHPWFSEACADANSPKRGYYIWRGGQKNGAKPPNNWGALFGGSAWSKAGEQYYLGLFSPYQPDLNWANSALRRELYAMARRWLALGVDGFRLDVITLIAKPGDFPDGETGENGYYDPRGRIAANPLLFEYLREFRQALAGYDIVTVGEASAADLELADKLTDPSEPLLDMVFSFEHMDIDGGETFKWNDRAIALPALRRVMAKWQTGGAALGLFWNNHDQPRMLSRMLRGEAAPGLKERFAKTLACCLHLMRGVPFIYQGEEIGMENGRFGGVEELRDVEAINAFYEHTKSGRFTEAEMMRLINLKGRDTARTPVDWGFAEEQLQRDGSVFSFYRELIQLRHKYDVVVNGRYAPYDTGEGNIFAYTRETDEEQLFVCCNFSEEEIALPIPNGFAVPLISNNSGRYAQTGVLAGFECAALYAAKPSVA